MAHTTPKKFATYDSRDNVVASYDARGPFMPDPLGLYTAGNINERGNATRYAYDGVDRRWREVKELTTTGDGGSPRDLSNPFNPDGLVILQTEFDANSRSTSRTDDTANRTVFAYDVLNRIVAQTNADGGFRTWQYDRDNHQIQLRDENNTLHTFGYDALGRRVTHQLAPDLAKTNSAGLPLLVGTTLQTFAYDGLSRLIRCTDNNDPADTNDDWTVQMKYDSLSRVVEEVQNGRAVSSGYVSDNRTELHYPGTNRVLHFAYDAHDQFKGLSNFTTVAIHVNSVGDDCPPLTYSFAASNLAPSLTVSQGLNANKLVTQIQQTSSTLGQIGGHFFNRNRNNDVISAFHMAQNGSDTINQNQALELDSLDRQSLFASQIQTPLGSTDLTRQQSFSGAQDVPLVRNGQNQIIQQVNHSSTHELEGGFFKNASSPGTGIRTRDTNFVFQWDGLNRLRVVRPRTAPSNEVARYTYDAHPAIHGGRRVQRTVTSGGPVIFVVGISRFYYDGPNCIEETFPITGMPERVTRQFLYGSRADEVLAMDTDTNNDGNPDQLSFYLRDHNNNITQLVDASGQPVEFYFYGYRGQPLIFNAATLMPLTNSMRGNPWLFTGQRYDFETGLYYYKARSYDPVYGVFLSRDPMGFWQDEANHGNPMAYVANNPWNRLDATGLGDVEDAIENLRKAKEKLKDAKEDVEKIEKIIKALEGDVKAKNQLIEELGEEAIDKLIGKITELLGLSGGWVKIIKAGADIGNALGQGIATAITEADCFERCKVCGLNDELVKGGGGNLVVIGEGKHGNKVRDDVWCRVWDGQIYAKCLYKIPKSFSGEACSALGVTPETTIWQWTKCRDW